MAEWLRLLETAQKLLDAGQAEKSSQLHQEGLKRFADDPGAVQWFTFNLMQSERALHGAKAAQAFLPRIIATKISWEAKLYTLELALASANADDGNLDTLYADALAAISQYISADPTTADINIMSCQSIARHIYRLFADLAIDPCFSFIKTESQYPVRHAFATDSAVPLTEIICNRWPLALRRHRDHHLPPERPLGFRHVGRAYMLRLGNNTVLFNGDGKALDTPYGPLPLFLRTVLERIFTHYADPHVITGVSLFIGDYFSQTLNYCHWIFDGLPRLIAAKLTDMSFDHVVGVFEDSVPFQMQSMGKLLENGQNYLGFGAAQGLIGFDDLYFADNNGARHTHHPIYGGDQTLVQGLKAALMATPTSQVNLRRLYMPRRHNRKVMNEKELLELLYHYDFEVINTDIMTFLDQVDVFASAEAVVAPHGAALTNLLFAPPSCKVLEFFPPFGGSSSFYLAASALKLDYACYIDDITQGPDRDLSDSLLNNTSDIFVDLEFVALWLERKFPSRRLPV